ncbi:MAG TPA: matrixin family metalloprotease, partial [Polyangiales bacterium]|nr:matrixin family metalloprotease [Polyangiales bacterium]
MSLLGVLAGAQNTAHAYTINTTELGKRIRWSVDSVSMQMDEEYEQYLEPGDAFAAIEMGFDAWRGLPRVPDLVIRAGRPASLGHHDGHPTNGIYLLKDWPYEKEKLAVTIVTYEMDTGRLLDADIVVNGEARFQLLPEPMTKPNDNYDLAAVLTHETGHVLGLGESKATPDATMWPYARPGDVEKRSLDADDEDGVIESYLSSPPPASGACGSLTVAGRAHTHSRLALGLWALAIFPFVMGGSRRRRRALFGAASLFLIAMLVGFGDPEAANPAARRIAAIEALTRDGTRDDRATLESLSGDESTEVARRAQHALGVILARAPKLRISAQTETGSARLREFVGTGRTLHMGRATRGETIVENGRFFTLYTVKSADGSEHRLQVPGGVRDGIGQRVMDAELPPADATDVAIVEQADGTQHWAYHQSGLLFGGQLG